jgi:hypothetical protein
MLTFLYLTVLNVLNGVWNFNRTFCLLLQVIFVPPQIWKLSVRPAYYLSLKHLWTNTTGVCFIMSLNIAALSHRQPASTGISYNNLIVTAVVTWNAEFYSITRILNWRPPRQGLFMKMMKAGAKCPLLPYCCVDWQWSLPLLPSTLLSQSGSYTSVLFPRNI